MTQASPTESETVAGYTLVERIGAGGYGEVWRAKAPGGIDKAVKLLYGCHNESRAVLELQSLERVKLLRHPFLLSLERIEVVDGRLIVVTELADMSLKDRYVACRCAGLAGIPRDELLGYLQDAAEALDYLHDRHALQHLDVKPENLLLVGNRAKLADFGLVRNLDESQPASVDGMTPRYAAPELFDGKPSHSSDQFSLAVVYAEMLTGMPPFEAKGSVQLAAQHILGAKPRLSLLTLTDQEIIGKALSKTTSERYANCGEFIARLRQASSGHASSSSEPVSELPAARPAVAPAPGRAGKGGAGISFSSLRTGVVTPPPLARVADVSLPVPSEGDDRTIVLADQPAAKPAANKPSVKSAARRLAPLTVAADAWQPRPTLLLGVGGLAGQVLSVLRRRLRDRGWQPDQIPAWPMLCLDTDTRGLGQLVDSKPGDVGWPREQLLPMPLRTTQEYRDESLEVLKWLSRRWLYNIPREPQTGGWRPIGRLALIDHAISVVNRLRIVLRELCTSDVLARSAQVTGGAFSGQPEIVLLASIAGGTGSGTVLDLAYLIRKLIADEGLPTCTVRGVLLHATDGNPAAQDLARASSVACLAEWAHFNRPGGGYPGEPALELPAFPSAIPTFDQTYVVHLGDHLTRRQLADETGRVAEYLYRDLATPAGGLLEECRATQGTENDARLPEQSLRTLGMYHVETLSADAKAALVDQVTRQIISRWLDAEPPPPPPRPAPPPLTAAHPAAGSVALSPSGVSGGPSTEEPAPPPPPPRPLDPIEIALKDVLGGRLSPEFFEEFHGLIQGIVHRTSTPAMLRQVRQGAASDDPRAIAKRLAKTLSPFRAATPEVELAEITGASDSMGRCALAPIQSAVHSFLRGQLPLLVEELAKHLPAALARAALRHGDVEARVASLDEIGATVRGAVKSQLEELLRQVDASRLIFELAARSKAGNDILRDLTHAALPGLGTQEGEERLLVFCSRDANTDAVSRQFETGLGEPATVCSTPDSQLAICFERGALNLTDIVASIMRGQSVYLEAAHRLHTRVDVSWSTLRLPESEPPR